jgi:hypothetical protein
VLTQDLQTVRNTIPVIIDNRSCNLFSSIINLILITPFILEISNT